MHFGICVLMSAIAAARAFAVQGNVPLAAAELAAALRRDLQHDNDDYAELPAPSTAPTLTPTPPVAEQPSAKDMPFPPPLRRVLEPNRTANATPSQTKPPSKASTTLEVVKVTYWYTSFTTQQKKTLETTTVTAKAPSAPGFVNRANDLAAPEKKLEPSGKGVEKGKNLESEEYFKRELRTFFKGSELKGKVGREPVMRAGRGRRGRRGRGGRGRGRPHGREPRLRGAPHARLPPAEVLDMAPARGARVYSKRLRHRLCSRSILNPEGPKYNSAGRIYLNQFTPRGRGHFGFEQTRAPRLVLPRCCNCCRKSVLGCE